MLCKVCMSIDFFTPSFMNKHHVNLDALFRAAKQGCDLCREICVDAERDTTRSASFDNPGIFELNRDSYIFYAIRHSTRQQGFHFQDPPKVVHSIAFSCGYMLAPRFETEFDIYVERDCNPTLARAISGRPSFATPFSDGCFALISTWMRECTELHKGYCPSQLVAPLPSRVLDVGMEGGSDRVFLKIADNAEIGAYFTLSHCWGPGPHFSTTTSNIAKFEHSIPLEELPSTFRDAILVTRKLGVRFLWIDSLCIIQDSHEDWAQEAASMHLYYKKSALTIAIDSAQEDQEGFLHLGRKNDPPVAVFPFPSAAVNHRAYSYFRRLTPSLSKLLAKSLVNKILLRRLGKQDKDELSGRGWTLQETILSPRTVHYSASELKWACQKNMISERNLGLPVTLPFIKKGFLSLSNRVSENEMLRYGSGSRIYEKWYIILDDYQRRALSVSSDRLPAISGLAREFASHISTTYKAGIWLEDLHLGLLWSYFGRGVKPGFYRAPSWSWAAMDYYAVEKADDSNYSELFGWSRGSTDPEVTNSNAEVVSCEVILKDNDPYGAVLGGELILRAFWITWPRKKLWSWDELWSLPPIVDDGFGTINRMSAGKIVCIFDERPKEKSTYDDPDFFLDVSLVLIFRAKSEHYSLLLKPVEGEGNEGKFVKIGVALLPYELDEIEMAESGWVKRDISII